MSRRCAPLAAIFLAMAPGAALALDRGHFKGMEEQDLAPIVAAFEGVQARYLELVNPPGKVPLAHIRKPSPKVNGLTEYAFYVYVNPEDAQWTRADLEKEFPRNKTVVRSAPLVKIVREQFARRNAQPSRGPHEPDYIIYLSLLPKIDTIEYLAVKGNVTPMTIKGAGGKPAVPAFLSRAKAMEVQAGLKRNGVEADRVGMDEKSFMRFIVDQAKQGRSVQIQGY